MTTRYDEAARNVLGGELASCSTSPMTGFYRNGCCETGARSGGEQKAATIDHGEAPEKP